MCGIHVGVYNNFDGKYMHKSKLLLLLYLFLCMGYQHFSKTPKPVKVKLQGKANSTKVFSDMKQHMAKLEQDLNRSKQLRENHTREYQQHIDEQQTRHEQQMVNIHLSFGAHKKNNISRSTKGPRNNDTDRTERCTTAQK